ncbi:MAG: hypothetical protein J7M25_06650 [Deltaproteobacteria bacterium]|nr:hypothetical protein [Deltaproteobacteria bacterium]
MNNRRWMLLSIFAVALMACGKKQQGTGKEQSVAPSPSCLKVQKRNQTCLDSLVDMAQEKSKTLMASTIARLPEPQRTQVQARMQSVLASRRDALQNVLRQSLGKPFMRWCVDASQSASGKGRVGRLVACLGKSDCRAYAACVGSLLDVGTATLTKAGQAPVAGMSVAAPAMTPTGQNSGTSGPGAVRPAMASPRSARPAAVRPAMASPTSASPGARPTMAAPQSARPTMAPRSARMAGMAPAR